MAKKKATGLSKKYYPSDELAELLGSDKPISRTDVTRKMWEYIKKHDLQDESNRRMIIPDDLLGEIIGSRPINMLKMAGKLNDHLFDE
jgi:upstream activation factor subunit UAF30